MAFGADLPRSARVNATTRFYFGLYQGSGGAIALATAAAVVQALLGLPITLLLRRLFDAGGSAGTLAAVLAALGILLLYLAGDALMLWANDRMLGVVKDAILRFREHLVDTSYRVPRTHVPDGEIGRLHAALDHDVERVDEMSSGLLLRVLPAAL